MRIRGNLVYLSAALLGAGFLMLSCASSSRPEQLTVRVPQHFTGKIHVDTCVSGAPANEATLDESGNGKTALCPAADHRVEIEVVGSDHYRKLGVEEVRIERAGDGMATSVEANVK